MADYSLLRKLSLTNPWHFLALGLGSGLCPKAPGTCGSFVAMFFCMGLIFCPWYVTLAIALVTFVLGVKACNEAEKAMGTHCLLYTSPSPRDGLLSRMPSSA